MSGQIFRYSLYLLWTALTVRCFQGYGSHAVFAAIGLAPVLVAFLLSSSFRGWLKRWTADRWEELQLFSKDPVHISLPWKSALFFAGVPMLILSLSNGRNIPSMDNYPTGVIPVSLLRQGDMELSEFLPIDSPQDPYYFQKTSKGVYSAYPIGMVFFSLPFTVVSLLVGGEIDSGFNQWRLAKFTGAVIAAVCSMLFLFLTLYFTQATGAYIATLFTMVGSPFWTIIGQGVWSHGGVVFGLLSLLAIELLSEKPIRLRYRVLQGLAMALMVSCRLPAAVTLVPLSFWMVTRSPRGGIAAGVFSLLFYAPIALYQWTIYGNFLGPQMTMATQIGLQANPLYGFIGSLVSPACGLLVYQPWLLLLPYLKTASQHAKEFTRFSIVAAIAFSLHFILVIQWSGWPGGVWGSRYFTEVLPLLSLMIAPTCAFFWGRPIGRRVLMCLLAFSFGIQAFGVYTHATQWFFLHPKHSTNVTEEELRMLDWRDPPFLYPNGISQQGSPITVD